MVVQRQLTEAFYNIKPHIDAIAQAVKQYGLDPTFLQFYPGHMEMHVFNDISNAEDQIMTIEYTPPVEERIELKEQRTPKAGVL